MTKRLSVTVAALTIAAAGCQGTIGGPGDNGGGPGGSTNPDPGNTGKGGNNNTTPPDPNAAGLMPLTRLDRREYNNTIRDLFGDTTNPADAFPEDHDGDFLFRRAGIVSSQDATTLRDAAETVAANA